MKGLVIKSTGSWYIVKDDKRKIYNCRLKGKFKLKNYKLSNPIITGDYVEFIKDEFQEKSSFFYKRIK